MSDIPSQNEPIVKPFGRRQFLGRTGAVFGARVAERVGVREVSSYQGRGGAGTGGGPSTITLGIVDAVQIGDLELRNVPVSIVPEYPPLDDGTQLGGAIGTVILYHFLSTMDYVNAELSLRQKTDEQLRAFEAESAGNTESTDFWMAPTHILYGRGSLNGNSMMCTLDTGGGEGAGATMGEHTALLIGAEIDYDNPSSTGQIAYPIVVEDVVLGPVSRQNIPGRAVAGQGAPRGGGAGFDAPSTITHEFYRPFAVTFDFVNMTLYIRR